MVPFSRGFGLGNASGRARKLPVSRYIVTGGYDGRVEEE
jgi:hypothetical protein